MDVSVTTPSLGAPSTTSTNVKSIKETLFHPAEIENPTSFLPASSFVEYEATGRSVPLVLCAFPDCVLSKSNNQGGKKSQPIGRAVQNPFVQVSGLFL